MAEVKVTVTYLVNGTVVNESFDAQKASSSLVAGGLAVAFCGGVDEQGRRVRSVGYREPVRIAVFDGDPV